MLYEVRAYRNGEKEGHNFSLGIFDDLKLAIDVGLAEEKYQEFGFVVFGYMLNVSTSDCSRYPSMEYTSRLFNKNSPQWAKE